jgi:hypothetical protein
MMGLSTITLIPLSSGRSIAVVKASHVYGRPFFIESVKGYRLSGKIARDSPGRAKTRIPTA